MEKHEITLDELIALLQKMREHGNAESTIQFWINPFDNYCPAEHNFKVSVANMYSDATNTFSIEIENQAD